MGFLGVGATTSMASLDKWVGLVKSGSIERLKVGELKGFLKEQGLSQTGEKGTLLFRIRAFLDGEKMKIDGKNPALLKAGELKKACATRGLSPLEYPDELLESLIGWLKTHGGGGDQGNDGAKAEKGASSAAEEGTGGAGGGNDGNVAHALVHRILELAEADDWSGILSLGATGGPKLTRQSPTAMLRKAYHRLSLNVHPDKLGQGVKDATRAFQAVVTAFERLSEPELPEEEKGAKKKGEKKGKTIARSNENCFRTRVFCPRCKTEWGLPIDGLPPYTYNYMMQGLKTYTCSTCLCEFGALTALHRCAHCKRPFEYDPHDYHRQVVCGNKGCTRPFGFFLFPVSDRVENEMRTELKAEQERRLKARESKLARLARSKRKHEGQEDEDDDRRLKLRMFVGGLLDACPRCGEEPDCAPEDREAHKQHLRECKDKGKIAAHQKKLRMEEVRQAEKEAKASAQEDLQSLRTWEFLGGKQGEMWLLTDDQLARQCKEKGLVGEGEDAKSKLSKDEMIAQLVAHGQREGPMMLTDGTHKGTAGGGRGGGGSTAMTRDSLPDNLHSLSLPQLRAVCAAHGFVPTSTTQSGVIREMEREVAKVEGHEEILLLED